MSRANTPVSPRKVIANLILSLILFFITMATSCWGQINNVTNDQSVPTPGVGHDYIGTAQEIVSPSNGSLSLRIPLFSPKGRGMTLPLQINYNSNGITQVTSNVINTSNPTTHQGVIGLQLDRDKRFLEQGGWGIGLPLLTAQSINVPGNSVTYPNAQCPIATGFVFNDPSGSRHALRLALPNFPLCNGTGIANGYTDNYSFSDYDGSYSATVSGTTTGANDVQALPFTITDNQGTIYHFPGIPYLTGCQNYCNVPDYIEDRNGNVIKFNLGTPANPTATFPINVIDSSGRNLITIPSFTSTSGDQLSVSGVSPAPDVTSSYKINWTNISYAPSYPVTGNTSSSCVTPPSTLSGGASMKVISSIVLANGEKYSFDYDTTFGLIKKITYPTGAYVKYVWGSSPQSSDAVHFALSVTGDYTNPSELDSCWALYSAPVILHRYVSTSGVDDGTTTNTANFVQQQDFTYQTTFTNDSWSTKITTVKTTDLVRTQGSTNPVFKTVYTYSAGAVPNPIDVVASAANQVPFENTIQYYDYNQSLLKTISKTWAGISTNPVLASEQTALPNHSTTKSVYTHDYHNNVTEQDDYAYGASTQTRSTVNTFTTLTGPLASLYSLPCKTQIYAGAPGSTVTAETDIYYDGISTLCSATGAQATASPANSFPTGTHDDTNFQNTPPIFRGNVTKVVKVADVGTSQTTTYGYDTAGQVLNKMDGCGNSGCSDVTGSAHTTTYTYDGTDTYLATVTYPTVNGNLLTKLYSYDLASGLLIRSTDENSKISDYAYIDPFNRLTKVQGPVDPISNARPTTSYTFNDSAAVDPPYNPTMTTTELINPTTSKVSTLTMDTMGRTILTDLGDPSGDDITTTTVDGMGQVWKQTSPQRSGVNSTTDGTTILTYDSLGRMLEQANPDSTTKWWCYNAIASASQPNCNAHKGTSVGEWVDAEDESGNDWQRTSDGLGRMVAVMEPNGGAVAANTVPTMETNYTYNVLGDLTGVAQWGGTTHNTAIARTRSFVYNSLSQLMSSYNPETGTISYTYDANGNLYTKTDARHIVATYSYDVLNRLTSRSYSDGTPTMYFGYDGKNESGAALSSYGIATSNALGRLSLISDESHVGEAFGYDVSGRLATQTNYLPSVLNWSNKATALYDLAGNMTSLTYPDGRVIKQGFDSVSRLFSVNYDSWNSTSVNSTYLMINSYDPVGHATATTFGNGITTAAQYNNRMETNSLAYLNGSANIWKKTFTWTPNGNLEFAADPVANTTRQYSYDNLNRLLLAQDLSGGSVGETSDTSDGSQSNVLYDSQALGGAGWGASNMQVMPNSTDAPDGSITAGSVTATAGSSDSFIEDSVINPSLYDGQLVTASIWLRLPSTGSTPPNVQLSIHEVGTAGDVYLGATRETVTTTWHQFQISGTLQNGLHGLNITIGGGGTITDGQSLQIWGPQLMVGAPSGTVTNFLPYSQLWSPPYWDSSSVSIAQNSSSAPLFTAPDSTSTGFEFTGTSSDSYVVDHVQNPGSYSGATVTGSVYLRVPSGTQSINLYVLDVNAGGASIITTQSLALTTSWQRFQITGTTGANLTDLYLQIGGAGSVASGQKIDIWGAQMEVGTSASQYVATLGSPITVTTDSTNILPSSEQFNSHGWVVSSGTVVANTTAVTAPDGSATADAVTAGTSAAYLQDYATNPNLYDNQTVTGSVYLKVDSGVTLNNLNLRVIDVSSNGSTNTSSTIGSQAVNLTTNWQRFSVTGTTHNGLTQLQFTIGGSSSLPAGSTIYMWGAEMVMGSTAGAPVETTNTTTNVANGTTVYLSANGLNQNFNYDAFGNLQQSGNYSFIQAYTTANQLSGWTYDASGNLLNDGLGGNFTYDAESRISTVGGYTYYYDADGNRVGKSSGGADTFYFGGRPIARLNGGQWTDLIYGVGGLLAEVPGTQTGVPVYRMTDQIGSAVGTLSSAGTLLSSTDYAPFGQIFAGGTSDPYKFTGKERDGESGKDYFGARYYASNMGRFMTPDWSVKEQPVPYAKLDNPQTLNLYAYVDNNPANSIDPDGHGLLDGVCNVQGGPWCEAHKDSSWKDQSVKESLRKVDRAISDASDWTNTYLAIPLAAVELGSNQGEDALAMNQISEETGVLEEKAIAVESSVSDKIAKVTAEAEKQYPKLAGKLQNHHIFPKFLGGPANGPLSRIPAAYHQLITNEFRSLTANYKDLSRSADDLMKAVYSKFPLPPM